MPGSLTDSDVPQRIGTGVRASRSRGRSTLSLRVSLGAAALIATAGMVSTAHAGIVTFDTPIVVPNTFDGIYINLLTGATGTTGASLAGWDFNPYNSGTSLSFFWNGTPAGTSGGVAGATIGPYLDLPVGSVVSGASTFSAATATAQTAAFRIIGVHLLGFRFRNEATGIVNYGAATLEVGGVTGFPLTITSWSFEDSGAEFIIADPFVDGFADGFED